MQGIHQSLVNYLHKGQWCRALMFSLICFWTNSWANNGDAGDLRCHCAHYDITVMTLCGCSLTSIGIPIIKIWQSHNCLYIFIIIIPLTYIEMGPKIGGLIRRKRIYGKNWISHSKSHQVPFTQLFYVWHFGPKWKSGFRPLAQILPYLRKLAFFATAFQLSCNICQEKSAWFDSMFPIWCLQS